MVASHDSTFCFIPTTQISLSSFLVIDFIVLIQLRLTPKKFPDNILDNRENI